MATSTVFTNNRSQAVRLPAETRFPAGVKKVEVRVVGADRVISPVSQGWDSFFNPQPGQAGVTKDFMAQRASQEQKPREPF